MRTKTHHIDAASTTFLAMLLFTLMTFLVGESRMEGQALSLLVLCAALVKGHLLGDHFMGLARVRGMWRWMVLIWLLLPGMMIGVAFVMAAR